MMDHIEVARWQGAVDAKLSAIDSKLDSLGTEKVSSHQALHQKIESVASLSTKQFDAYSATAAARDAENERRIDVLESKWDRLFGAAIGIGIGAGAVGGGVGALVSSLIA